MPGWGNDCGGGQLQTARGRLDADANISGTDIHRQARSLDDCIGDPGTHLQIATALQRNACTTLAIQYSAGLRSSSFFIIPPDRQQQQLLRGAFAAGYTAGMSEDFPAAFDHRITIFCQEKSAVLLPVSAKITCCASKCLH